VGLATKIVAQRPRRSDIEAVEGIEEFIPQGTGLDQAARLLFPVSPRIDLANRSTLLQQLEHAHLLVFTLARVWTPQS